MEKQIDCPECGAPVTPGREDHHYVEIGLPNVWLHGVEVRRCTSCGDEELVIPRLAQLHRVIAESLARKRERLTAAEVRFLRKYLGWSGEDFAATMGVRPETVSRWENEKESMGPSAERLLRLMAVRAVPVESYPNERLAEVAIGDAQPSRVDVRATKSGWHAITAAA
jgi:putative zinc finger/helix-turn-helix YgiT family protein